MIGNASTIWRRACTTRALISLPAKNAIKNRGWIIFGARYYGSALPQSWNLYGYVRNNPLAAVDPTGMGPVFVSSPEVMKALGTLGIKQAVQANINADKQAYNDFSDRISSLSGGKISLGHLDVTPLFADDQKLADQGQGFLNFAGAIAGSLGEVGEPGLGNFRAPETFPADQ